jgi:hypothetical protein
MTVNPDTGLPEAFNFMRFMPMIAGAALSPFITPVGAAAVVGAVEGVRTKSMMGGLKGALGAYGGASLGTSLASFGAEGAGQTALAAGTETGTTALNTAVAAPTPVIPAADTTVASIDAGAKSLTPTFSNVGPDQAGELLRSSQISPEAYSKYAQGYSQGVSQYNPTTFSNMGAGIGRAFTDPGAAGSALMADPMRTASTVGSLALGSQAEPEPYQPPGKKTYASSTKADPYKRNYRDNPNPYDTSSEFEYFSPNALYVKEGGVIKMQAGGQIDMGNGYNPFSNLSSMGGALGAVRQDMTTFDPNFNKPNFNAARNLINSTNTTTEQDVMGGNRNSISGGLSRMISQPTPQPGQQIPAGPVFSNLPSIFPSISEATPSSPNQSPNANPGGNGGPFPLEGRYGIIKMQTGGTPPVGMPTGLPDDYTAYMQQLQQMINLKGSPAGLPGFSSPISQPTFATQATSGSKPNTYAPGGITRIQKEGQVRGNGDGMEDKVYGNIEGRQKVALSRDEFIVPADVVSGIGNGSSNAGADKLYKMMDRVRKARTGIKKQGKQIKGDRYVPA